MAQSRQGDENRVADEGDDHAGTGVEGETAFAEGLASLETGQDQADGTEHEVGACAAGDAHDLLAVDGEVVAEHAETETEGHHVETQEPTADEEETIPRKSRKEEGGTRNEITWKGSVCGRSILLPRSSFLLPRKFDRSIDQPAEAGHDEGQPEEELEAGGELVDEDADGGRDSHSEVVGETVVADALGTAAGGQHVDGDSRVGDGQGAEGPAVEGADDGEQQKRGRGEIACKEDGEGAEADHQHRLAGEGVDDVTAKRSAQQSRDGVAREHEADHVLCCAEMLAQIERQQWREHIERKEQREVRRHHLTVVLVPQFFRASHKSSRIAVAKV